MQHTHIGLALLAGLFLGAQGRGQGQELGDPQPNFVWVVSEDNSVHSMGLFVEGGATAPAIEELAGDGIVFERAFSGSPVCSVARTSLMSGCLGPRIGAQFHRKLKPVGMPEGLRVFPQYLREAGYFTSNRHKTDFNVITTGDEWDESSKRASWRNRPEEGTPFFHMQSFSHSHEGRLHFPLKQTQGDTRVSTVTDTESVNLPPYLPDTDLQRYTLARQLDCIQRVDQEIGKVIEQLREDGLLEDTFVFYFGDHGGVLPRSKGYLYETGLHVPLVVRIPENYQHLVHLDPGTRTRGFVRFVDLGATVLELAGLEAPHGTDGAAFLGPDIRAEDLEKRKECLGYADRFDEKYDLCRSLRQGRYKYIRNFEAHYPHGLQNNYRYRMLAYRQWREMHHRNELDATRSRFFHPKAAEELYDLESDPYEVHNLAEDPTQQERLQAMRARLTARLKALADLSFFTEAHLLQAAGEHPAAYGQSQAARIATLIDAANLCLDGSGAQAPHLTAALESPDDWVRYWALTACATYGAEAGKLEDLARANLNHSNLAVRIRAAEFLAIATDFDARKTLATILRESDSVPLTLMALGSVVFLRDGGPGQVLTMDRAQIPARDPQIERRLDYLGW